MKTRISKIGEVKAEGLFNSESGASTVIAAVLLLSIIFTLFAVVKIAYVPEWRNDAEQLHMNEVQREMAGVKSTIDTISFQMALNNNYSVNSYPVTVPFRMGGGEIPVLEPSKSSGTLSVNTEPCFINVVDNSSNHESLNSQICGGITYFSNNKQYVDQVFRYENGALLIKQGDRSLMRQPPAFSITADPSNTSNYTILIQTINITGNPDTISSDSEASLTLKGISHEDPIYVGDFDSFNCTVVTKYPDAWKSYFNETSKKAQLLYPTYFTLENNTSDNGVYEVYFNLTSSKNLYRIYTSKSSTLAELGIGSNYNI